jgi:hypothetical protein
MYAVLLCHYCYEAGSARGSFIACFAQRVSANLNAAHYLHHWCIVRMLARHSLGLALRKLHQKDEINLPPASQANDEL